MIGSIKNFTNCCGVASLLGGCEEIVGAVRLLSGPPGVLNPCLIAKVVFRRLNIQLYFWGGQIVFWGGQIVFWGGQIVFWGGRDAQPTIKFSDCGTGILPVPKNGERCEIN